MRYGFVTVEHADITAIQMLFDVKIINEKITVRHGESMKVTKVGSLKCHVIHLNGSSSDVTLKEIK
jgi:hypothetical protein